MRLFTGIDVPAEIRQRLRELVDRLRPSADLTWSPIHNLHVTTKFIGDWPEARLSELKSTLAQIPLPSAFEIAIRGLGFFPNARNPRVFWAGIESGPALAELARDTEAALIPLGVPAEDRDYHPHLTLARRRKPVPVEALRQQVQPLETAGFGSFEALSFFLYQSAGGRYTKLQEYPFVN